MLPFRKWTAKSHFSLKKVQSKRSISQCYRPPQNNFISNMAPSEKELPTLGPCPKPRIRKNLSLGQTNRLTIQRYQARISLLMSISSTFFAGFFVRKCFFDQKKLSKRNFCTKNARKMLMKLTPRWLVSTWFLTLTRQIVVKYQL